MADDYTTAVRVTAKLMLERIESAEHDVYLIEHRTPDPAADYIAERQLDKLRARASALREAASILSGALYLGSWQNLREFISGTPEPLANPEAQVITDTWNSNLNLGEWPGDK